MDLEDLVQRLRDGDESVSEMLILEHFGLARALARHAVARHPEKADDIRAAAAFGLVQAVRWAPDRMYNNNIGPYITTTVRRFIREFLEKDHTIRIPKDAWAKMIKALELDDLSDYARMKALKELKTVSMVFQASVPDGKGEYLEDFTSGDVVSIDNDYLTVVDIYRFLKLNYQEHVILDMRVEGHTLADIAARLDRSIPTIHQALRRLQERYRTIQRAHPTLPEPPYGI